MKFGVFIRSGQQKEDIVKDCKRFLKEIKSDARISYVIENEVCKGVNILFNSESAELEFLKKKYLIGSDSVSTIHSYNTTIALHDAFPSDEEDFRNIVREQIKKLSSLKVLDIKKVPFSCEDPDIGSGKWIINLDVPEVDDLEVFKTMGIPDMGLKFPADGGCYKVTFYCRLCQKDGHTQFECPSFASTKRELESDDDSGSSSSKRIKVDFDRLSSSEQPSTEDIYPDLSMTTRPENEDDGITIIREISLDSSKDGAMPSTSTQCSSQATPLNTRSDTHQTCEVVIPRNIRALIEDTPIKVLNTKKLEAFFSHVRKRVYPAEFARLYTENVEGLFDQLNEIYKRYHLLPKTNNKDDGKFIAMLSNVIKRFYNGYKAPLKSSFKIPL